MEKMKKALGDVIIYGACLISLIAIFGDVFEWMLYM